MLKKFHLIREVDVTGVSGTGKVMESVELFNGAIVSSWISDFPSQTWHQNIFADLEIHGHGGNSKFVEVEDPHEYPILFALCHSEARSNTRIGKVADIGVFSNGKCFLNWRVVPYQIEFFDSIEHLKLVHSNNSYAYIISEVAEVQSPPEYSPETQAVISE